MQKKTNLSIIEYSALFFFLAIMKKVLSFLIILSFLFPVVLAEGETTKCQGTKLNTDIPFIGNCIEYWDKAGSGSTTVVNQVNAFPKLMGALMNIVMTASLIIGFVMILAGGVMIATTGAYQDGIKGKQIIIKVWTILALIWLSGVILKLINPTFFV